MAKLDCSASILDRSFDAGLGEDFWPKEPNSRGNAIDSSCPTTFAGSPVRWETACCIGCILLPKRELTRSDPWDELGEPK